MVVFLLQKTAPPTEQVKCDERLNTSGCGGVFLAGVVMVMLCFYRWWCKWWWWWLWWWWFVCVCDSAVFGTVFLVIKAFLIHNAPGDCFTVATEDWPSKGVVIFLVVVLVFLLLVVVMVLLFLLSVVMMVLLLKCCFGVVVAVVFL